MHVQTRAQPQAAHGRGHTRTIINMDQARKSLFSIKPSSTSQESVMDATKGVGH